MNLRPHQLLNQVRMGEAVNRSVIHELSNSTPLNDLIDVAGALRDEGHGGVVSYSRKVFIPLTHLCRDVCHYCTFAKPPRKGEQVFMSRDQVLAVARAGAEAGCKEALFTLGDKPEIRYTAARHALERLGHQTTLSYLAEVALLVYEETGLYPHLNPGVMSREDILELRDVSVSQGLMLESLSDRLCEKGGPPPAQPWRRETVPGRRARRDPRRRSVRGRSPRSRSALPVQQLPVDRIEQRLETGIHDIGAHPHRGPAPPLPVGAVDDDPRHGLGAALRNPHLEIHQMHILQQRRVLPQILDQRLAERVHRPAVAAWSGRKPVVSTHPLGVRRSDHRPADRVGSGARLGTRRCDRSVGDGLFPCLRHARLRESWARMDPRLFRHHTCFRVADRVSGNNDAISVR